MAVSYQKNHAVTVIATADVATYRFIGYDGAYATSAAGLHDAQGVSEYAALTGEAFAAITCYSAPVEVAEAIAYGDFVKPAADGTGRAIVGTATDHCGRALSAAGAAGQFAEVQILPHVHPVAP
ncbi:MAG: capsid cement protein [Sulfuricellaceae bacterium]